jgi:hypothetical protein
MGEGYGTMCKALDTGENERMWMLIERLVVMRRADVDHCGAGGIL